MQPAPASHLPRGLVSFPIEEALPPRYGGSSGCHRPPEREYRQERHPVCARVSPLAHAAIRKFPRNETCSPGPACSLTRFVLPSFPRAVTKLSDPDLSHHNSDLGNCQPGRMPGRSAAAYPPRCQYLCLELQSAIGRGDLVLPSFPHVAPPRPGP